MTRFEIGLIAALLLIWFPGIRVLADFWSRVDYASHGFMIPFVALWAATAHRDTLAGLSSQPARGGLMALAALAIAYVGALGAGNPPLLGLIAVLTVVACVCALRGWPWAKVLAFPLGYLVFMIPLPADWVTPLIVRLQVLVSSFAVWSMQRFGVTIFREGNVLTLPGDESLFVAEACSGITSLITLLPIGVFIAYFTEYRFWRRALLVAAVVPIALLANLARVVLTVWVAIGWGASVATEGPLHEWAGVATYVVGCLALLGIGRLMTLLSPVDEDR